MKTEQHFSKKKFGERTLYRIHDIVNNKLSNIRVVLEDSKGVLYLPSKGELTDEEYRFTISQEDIHAIEDNSVQKIKEFLKKHEKDVVKNVNGMYSYMSDELEDVIQIGGHTYIIQKSKDHPNYKSVSQLRFIYPDNEGKVIYSDAVMNESHMDDVAVYLLENDKERPLQIGQAHYISFKRYKHTELIVMVPLAVIEDKNGELAWSVNGQMYSYYKKEGKKVKRVEKPDIIDKKELEELGKRATSDFPMGQAYQKGE